jgi:RND family efflux transporter MFP subunit
VVLDFSSGLAPVDAPFATAVEPYIPARTMNVARIGGTGRQLLMVQWLLLFGCDALDGAPIVTPLAHPLTTMVDSMTNRHALSDRPSSFVGVILARDAVDLTPRCEGKLRDVLVRIGDRIPAGAVVAVLDVAERAFDVRMAEASLKAAEGEREQISLELDEARERLARREALSAEALASAEELSTARYQHEVKQARMRALRAMIEERRARLEQLRRSETDLRVRAPFEGRVAARYVDPGAHVTKETPIVRIVGTSSPFIRFAVEEGETASLKIGSPVRATVGDGQGEISVRGRIERIGTEIDAASRMVVVEAAIDSLPEVRAVLLGRIAHVTIEAGL